MSGGDGAVGASGAPGASGGSAGRLRALVREHGVSVALRALIVIAFPVCTVALAKSLGYYERLPDVPVPALYGHAIAWQTLLIVGVTGTLALVAAFSKRAGAFAFGVATGVILWLGFPFSQLRWYRFVPGMDRLALLERVELAPWLAAAGLLAAASALALGDAAVRTRRAYTAKDVPADVAAAASARVGRGAARAAVAGVAGAGVLAVVVLALVGVTQNGLAGVLPRVNPVLALLALGVVLALGLHALLRPRDVASGDAPPLWAARDARGPQGPREPGRRATATERVKSSDEAVFDDFVASELQRDARERGER